MSWRAHVYEEEQRDSQAKQSVTREPGALFFATLRSKYAVDGQNYTENVDKSKCFRCHSQVRLKGMPGCLVKPGRLGSMLGRLVKPGRRNSSRSSAGVPGNF